jgi:DNA replication protein DnaC
MEASVGRYAPPRFQGLDWGALPLSGIAERHTAAASVVRRYAGAVEQNVRQGRGLWLLGNKGTGKTTLAYYVAQRARAVGMSVLTRNTTDLLNELRDSYKPDAQPTTRQIIDAVTHVELLHLEDVAVPRPNDWVLEQLYTIVNRRYEHNKAIVFTSDTPFGAPLDPNGLADHIGERTFSRLMQMVGDPITMTGMDYRLTVGA